MSSSVAGIAIPDSGRDASGPLARLREWRTSVRISVTRLCNE